jgi:sec-independent protein translocase protein TatA
VSGDGGHPLHRSATYDVGYAHRERTIMRIFDHPAQLLIIVLLVVVLFGAKRLPDAARGLGRSLRIFKSEVTELQNDDKKRDTTPAPTTAPEPLEGRVVDDKTRTGSEQRHDA